MAAAANRVDRTAADTQHTTISTCRPDPQRKWGRASGTACAGSQARVDEVVLLTRREGDDVVVETHTEHGRLDLRLELPDSLPVVVDDSSGSVHIADVAAVALDDGSGSVQVERVRGDVSIRDGSGDLDIETVGGTVTVEDDGSGSIAIATVTGDVLIGHDGSGSIDVATVVGTVTIEHDGSGGIEVSDVTEDVVIAEDGSGSIRVTDVRGDFSVGRDGSGLGRVRGQSVGVQCLCLDVVIRNPVDEADVVSRVRPSHREALDQAVIDPHLDLVASAASCHRRSSGGGHRRHPAASR